MLLITPLFGQSGFFRHYGNNDEVITWKHFPHYRSFVMGIHRLMFNDLLLPRIGCWTNRLVNGDLTRHEARVTPLMMSSPLTAILLSYTGVVLPRNLDKSLWLI